MTPRRILRSNLLTLGLAAAVASASFAGCGEEREVVDRTQPNRVEKAYFADEWYYQRTIVDMPGGDGFTFVGEGDLSGLSVIKWDIQENWLYARRQLEKVDGADRAEQEGEDYEGEVVAAFRIESHFDVAQAYDPSTGERLNQLEENSWDRPWYEREFMRVDWSTNHVTNYNLSFETERLEAVPYYVQAVPDENGVIPEDAPHFEDEYFDITSRIFASASTVYFDGYGEIPLCWLTGEEFKECGASEFSLRHSFKKIDPNHQYEPEPYKGAVTDLFGFFTTDRLVYDPLEGIRHQNTQQFLNRHNLWENWYTIDANGVKQEIPPAQRTLRPIVYHVNKDMPEDLKPIVLRVADDWNEVFSDVVKSMGYPLADGERVFIGCPNNPVQAGDDPHCGQAGYAPRLGDLRVSFMAYVPKYMKFGLLGYGPSNIDPRTGEILSGMAYVYHHNNLASYETARMVQLLVAGEESPEVAEFIDGVDIKEWAEETRGEREAAPRTFGLESADFMVRQLSGGWATRYWDSERHEITEADIQQIRTQGFQKWVAPYFDRMFDRGILNGERSGADGRLRQLEGTYIEDLLVNDELLMAAGNVPGEPVTEDQMSRASIARGGLAGFAKQRDAFRNRLAEERNLYLAEMADDALMGVARRYANSNLSFQELYQQIRMEVYAAVWTHEVGHTLGLMHNFGGSDDAVNYFDRYWELRDDGTVGPRTEDPITDNEIDNDLYNHAYSSIMDYAGRYTVDGEGVGKYDRAAMLFGYAGKMEVFRDIGEMDPGLLDQWRSSNGDVLTGGGPLGLRTLHYTELYNTMGDRLYAADNRILVDVEDFGDNFAQVEVDGEVLTRVPYIYCSHGSSDLSDHCLTRDAGADSMERMSNILDDLNTWYIMRNFPRGRVGVDTFNYVSRYYGRVYDRMKNWNNLYALYAALLPQFFNEAQLNQFFTDSRTGFGTKTWAVQNAFNYLVQTLLMPDVGAYSTPSQQPDGSRLAEKATGLFASTELDITDARYYSTDWFTGERECGYEWNECLHHVGFYLDKIMAIEALSDSATNFVARATPEDIREWEVSYYSTFPEQIARINDAIMSQDWAAVAPYVRAGDRDELVFPNYAGDLDDAAENPIDPMATFTIQLYWQVLGQARFPNNYDRSFREESRIFELGSGLAPEVDTDDLITFTDENTGITYGAFNMGDRETAGETMIRRARCLSAIGAGVMEDENGIGEPSVLGDCKAFEGFIAEEVNLPDEARAQVELQDFTELLQIMADMAPMMDYGDPYNP